MNVKTMMMAGAMALALASCGSSKQAHVADFVDLAGEWDVVAINGKQLENEQLPYMGFDVKEGRVYGHTGCNRLTGAIDTTAAPGVISFDAIGSTRMMCEDMELEEQMLNMLRNVKGYGADGADVMLLTDAEGKTVARLQKRCGEMKEADLQGDWRIVNVQGMPATDDLETAPSISFDTKEKKTHGNASCNLFHGTYKVADGQQLSFGQMGATMKMCKDMTFEQKLMAALAEVRRFGKMHDGNVGLFDENGQLLIELSK